MRNEWNMSRSNATHQSHSAFVFSYLENGTCCFSATRHVPFHN